MRHYTLSTKSQFRQATSFLSYSAVKKML